MKVEVINLGEILYDCKIFELFRQRPFLYEKWLKLRTLIILHFLKIVTL